MKKETKFDIIKKRIGGKAHFRQLKDQEFTDSIITIRKIRKAFKTGKGSYHYEDYLICVKVEKHWGDKISTCFADTEKGREHLIEFLKRECYLGK